MKDFCRNVLDDIGKDLEIGRAPGDVHVPGQGPGFAGIETLRFNKIIEPGVDAVGQFVQQRNPLLYGHRPPGSRHGGSGCFDRRIHFLPAGLVNLGIGFARHRVQRIKHAAACRTDKFAADKMAERRPRYHLLNFCVHYLNISDIWGQSKNSSNFLL